MSNFQITTSKHRTTIMGIAMIAIMLFHQYFTSVFPFNAFHNFGYWGVDVFLFLSGMGLVKSLNNNPLKIFYAHRFYRIIPCCILCGSVKYLIFHLLGSSVAILKAGLNIGLLSILSFDLWFIPAIIILYSITPLLFQALSKWTYTTILLVLLLFVLNGIFIRPNIGFDLTLTGILSRTAERLPVFMAGMYVVMKEEWIDSKIRYSYSFLITAILLKLLCKAGLPIPCNQVCIYFALTMGMPALISFISIVITKTPHAVTKAINLFGHYSLELYLVHEFIFWSLIVIYNNANPFLMLILGFIISGISAILSKWIIEKFKPDSYEKSR